MIGDAGPVWQIDSMLDSKQSVGSIDMAREGSDEGSTIALGRTESFISIW